MAKNQTIISVDDLHSFLEEFQNESPRASALIGASFLDHCLGNIITAFLTDEKVTSDLLNGFNAPLGTFDARIRMAYALGLISDDEYYNLELIRKIRNEFAHGLHGLSFTHENILKHSRKLKFHKGMLDAMPEKLRPPRRTVFAIVTGLLAISLIGRNKMVEKERLTRREWGLRYPEVVGDWQPSDSKNTNGKVE